MRKRAGPLSEILLEQWRDLDRRAENFSYEHSIPLTGLELFQQRMCETTEGFEVAEMNYFRLGRMARIILYEENLKFVSLSGLAQ